jgi:hypothetical protein
VRIGEGFDPARHDRSRQIELAVVAEVDEGRRPELATWLAELDRELPKWGPPGPVVRLPLHNVARLHFARIVVLAPAVAAASHLLVLSFDADGPLDDFVAQLVDECGDGLRALLGHCRNFAASTPLPDYVRSHRVPAAAFYVGAPGRSVARIRAEHQLRSQLEDFLDQRAPAAGWSTVSAAEVRRHLQAHAFALDPAWRQVPPPPPRNWLPWLQFGAAMATGGLVWLLYHCWGGWAVAGAVGLVGLGRVFFEQILQRLDEYDDSRRQPVVPGKPVAEGPVPVQNWLTHSVVVKPGWARMALLRINLTVTYFMARARFVEGDLDGIPTILFARWAIIGAQRRLIFVSNYESTWDAYLDDFINHAGKGLTSIWSNSQNFPRTRPIFREGAAAERPFKQWTRAHQVDTAVWYSAYPGLSLREINQNSAIRRGLHGAMRDSECQRWLALFGGRP